MIFILIVDNFVVEYVGNRHAHHLQDSLKEHYDITKKWEGDLYDGINLKWEYTHRTFRLTMDNYIADLRLKWNHIDPKKHQISPYKHTPIVYGAKIQYATDPSFSLPLDTQVILRD